MRRAEDMPAFTVRCVKITKSEKQPTPTTLSDIVLRGQPASGRERDRSTTMSPDISEPPVKVTAFGPLALVTLLGCLLSITLFTLSVVFGDGMSMIATILLSLLTSLTGWSNSWTLNLPKRRPGIAPAGDTVIRYANGSFLVVKCGEDVARELFFAPENIDYLITNPATYRLISLVGTLMLMLGVIALANARLELQFAWAGAYVIINVVHWIAAAVPPGLHWDFSCYVLEEQGIVGGNTNPAFTEALWKAIVLTQSTEWAKIGKAAPQTKVWDAWLSEAEEKLYAAKTIQGQLLDPFWGIAGTLWVIEQNWAPKAAWDRIFGGTTVNNV